MDGSLLTRRALKWTVGTLAVLLAVIVLLAAAAAALADSNQFRAPFIRFIAARIGRPIRVEGALEAHLLSLTPRLIAEGVTIENPPWTPPGPTAEIAKLSLSFDLLPLFANSFVIRSLDAQGARLHLQRDSEGRANWQAHEPGSAAAAGGPPLMHSLSIPNARLELEDARRNLKFAGTVSAQDAPGQGDVKPLQIEGAGKLNGKAATFALNGDALATVRPEQSYRFAFDERSGASRLSGRGALPRPFDFREVDAKFESTGENLKDLYYLVGLSMPNTGPYRLSGTFARRGRHFQYSDLLLNSGQSDIRGTVSIESSHGASKLEADLQSQSLRLADLGARAASQAASQAPRLLLLSDIALPLSGIRRADAIVDYHAQSLIAGHMTLHALAAHMTIDHGILILAPLSASFPEGKGSGRVRFDATHELPTADLDLSIANLRLGQFDRKGAGQPPFDGLLQARLMLKGHGSSMHQFAASSNGTITAVLPHGAIRASFAELAGMDLTRGIGLMLRKDQQETGIRCGIASFQVHDGTMDTQSLVIDSDPVLITGTGQIHLDSEALELAIQGQPKHLRLLRVHAPVMIRGTLLHPSIGLDAHGSSSQTGAAVALGLVLAPLTAVLGFVDPHLAKDADCAALLAEGKTDGVAAGRQQ
jgi:AsmA family protein